MIDYSMTIEESAAWLKKTLEADSYCMPDCGPFEVEYELQPEPAFVIWTSYGEVVRGGLIERQRITLPFSSIAESEITVNVFGDSYYIHLYHPSDEGFTTVCSMYRGKTEVRTREHGHIENYDGNADVRAPDQETAEAVAELLRHVSALWNNP